MALSGVGTSVRRISTAMLCVWFFILTTGLLFAIAAIVAGIAVTPGPHIWTKRTEFEGIGIGIMKERAVVWRTTKHAWLPAPPKVERWRYTRGSEAKTVEDVVAGRPFFAPAVLH